MREWWRWTLRGVAALALVAGGVLLALGPTASVVLPGPAPLGAGPLYSLVRCVSPFDRIKGAQLSNGNPHEDAFFRRSASVTCSAAINGREHIVEALGGGAILLVGLSFLPRRRAMATKRRLEPSPV
jgi:hypothetical protein